MRILWLLLVPMVAASGWDVGDTSQADILVNGESVGTAVRTVQDDHVIIDITLTASPVALQIRETYTEPGVLLRVQEFRDGEAVRATTYPDGLDRAFLDRPVGAAWNETLRRLTESMTPDGVHVDDTNITRHLEVAAIETRDVAGESVRVRIVDERTGVNGTFTRHILDAQTGAPLGTEIHTPQTVQTTHWTQASWLGDEPTAQAPGVGWLLLAVGLLWCARRQG